ncbi:MAG TPA: tetratricopeptide repeat protein [Lysobacter sp.]
MMPATSLPDIDERAQAFVRGASGRLFYESYERYNTCIARAAREPLFPVPVAVRWKRLLETRARLLKLRGLRLHLLIAPDAHFIYRDEVPEHLVLPARSPARQFCELFSGIDNLTIINPEDALIGARGGIDVYRANDTHWSAYGAFVAYRTLIEQLPATTPMHPVTAAEVGYRFLPSYGDMGALAEPEVVADMPVASIRDGAAKLVFNRAAEGRNAWTRYESSRGRGHAFVLRDSFATELAVYFNATFARVDLLGATSRLHLEAIDEEKPDVVIWEVAERRLLVEENDYHATTAYEVYAFDRNTPQGSLALEAYVDKAEGDLGKALERARSAAQYPEAGTAYQYLLADLLLANRMFEEAEATIRRALELRDDRPAYWHLLSVIARHLGQPEVATAASERAANLAPHNGKFVADCGYNLLAAGRRAEAIDIMSACRAVVSDSPYLSYWLATAYHQAGDPENARKEAINACLLLPNNPKVYALMWTIER